MNTHIHLPASLTVATVVAVIERYESSLQNNGIPWLDTRLIERAVELPELDRDVLRNIDASYLSLLLASHGVVNFWDQEPGKQIRTRKLQSRLLNPAG